MCSGFQELIANYELDGDGVALGDGSAGEGVPAGAATNVLLGTGSADGPIPHIAWIPENLTPV